MSEAEPDCVVHSEESHQTSGRTHGTTTFTHIYFLLLLRGVSQQSRVERGRKRVKKERKEERDGPMCVTPL